MTLENRIKKLEATIKSKDEKKLYVLYVSKDSSFEDDQSIGYRGEEQYQRLQAEFKKYPKLERILREHHSKTQADIKDDEKAGSVVGLLSFKESELVENS